MKKNIGNAIALYPTPLVVVGAMVNGKPNWALAGHLGIMGHDRIMISLAQAHYTNIGIRAQRALSVNIVDEALLPRADYVGGVSGGQADKSGVFGWHAEAGGAPLIDDAPVSMDCTVVDTCQTDGFDNFICKIEGTCAEEALLNAQGKPDYRRLKPVLFEMPTYEYLGTGDALGKCLSFAGKAR